jgi:hypothetical protein
MPLSIEKLKSDLVKEFGLENLPEEKQQELLDIMTETVMKQIFLSLGEKMGDEGADEFDALMKAGDQTKLEAFIKRYVPDPEAFVAGIVAEFRDAVKNGGIPSGTTSSPSKTTPDPSTGGEGK